MPFFARRRIQSMLSDLAAVVGTETVQNTVQRLNGDSVQSALPAEVELAFIWAVSRLGPVETEPVWWGDTHPDLLTSCLVDGRDVVLDIAGVANGDSNDELMARQSHELVVYANQIRRGFGQKLFMTFLPERGYRSGRYVNRLKGNGSTSTITPQIKTQLSHWILTGAWEKARLDLIDDALAVQVEASPVRRSGRNYRSSLISSFDDIRKNPIYSMLKRKRDQLKNDYFRGLRGVAVFDLGSDSIQRKGLQHTWEPVFEYHDAIRQFFEDKRSGLDFVLVIAAESKPSTDWRVADFIDGRNLFWRVEVISRPGLLMDTAGIEAAVSFLPPPSRLGYAARQAARSARSGSGTVRRYRNTIWSWERGVSTKISFSSGALVDFLAGRISEQQFREKTGFKLEDSRLLGRLSQGKTVRSLSFESGGLDADDDRITIELDEDPSVSDFLVT
jgi:hypothetical protein